MDCGSSSSNNQQQQQQQPQPPPTTAALRSAHTNVPTSNTFNANPATFSLLSTPQFGQPAHNPLPAATATTAGGLFSSTDQWGASNPQPRHPSAYPAAAAAYASANAGAAASLGAIPTELMRSNGNMGSDSDIKAERIVLNPGSDQDAMARAFANVEKAEQAKLAGHYVGATGDSDEVAQTVSAAAPAAHVAVGNSGSDCVVLRTADAEETGPSLLGVPSNVRESVQRLDAG